MQGSHKRVQSTNDSSILSKHSMVKSGYFNDEFLKYFVTKDAKRSPLINRGYYIRMKAVNHVLQSFLESKSAVKKQVVSLGAGFDTSFFRFKSEGLLEDTKFFEVDFPDVVKHKVGFIKQHQLLNDITNHDLPDENVLGLQTYQYSLIGCDLKDLPALEKQLFNHGLDTGCRTLLLSEVVLSYLDPASSSAVIRWAAGLLTSAIFISYEQVYPDDPFGIVMMNHFNHLGSPLRSIRSFPTPEAQVRRYKDQNWTTIKYHDMNCFYNSLSADEKQRIDTIEPFDEFEEWHLKCAHYILLGAFKGSCEELANQMFPSVNECRNAEQQITVIENLPPVLLPVEHGDKLQRYGHRAIALPSGHVVVTGGFGLHGTKHMRLTGAHILSYSQDGWTCQEAQLVSGNDIGSRMFHTMTLLDHNSILIHGGRTSPYKPCTPIVLLTIQSTAQETLENSSSIEKAHSGENNDVTCETLSAINRDCNSRVDSTTCECRACSSMDSSSGTNRNIGCDYQCMDTLSVSNDGDEAGRSNAGACCGQSEGNRTTFTCTTTVLQCRGTDPSPRWRHTATRINYDNGKEGVLVYGGRTLTEPALNDCYLLDTDQFTWTRIALEGDPPECRHSHAATPWGSHHVILSGGLGPDSTPVFSLHVINTQPMAIQNLEATPPLPPRYSHTAHMCNDNLILIGGVIQGTTGYPSITVLDMSSMTWKFYSLPVCPSPTLLMLHNHCSVDMGAQGIMVIGGGGNCFSFGTHLNKGVICLDKTILNV